MSDAEARQCLEEIENSNPENRLGVLEAWFTRIRNKERNRCAEVIMKPDLEEVSTDVDKAKQPPSKFGDDDVRFDWYPDRKSVMFLTHKPTGTVTRREVDMRGADGVNLRREMLSELDTMLDKQDRPVA